MRPQRVGVGLLGRTFGLHDKADSPVAHDARLLLESLADRHPDVEFVVFSPSRETPTVRDNVNSPWEGVRITTPIARSVAISALRDCDAALVFVNSPQTVSVNDCPKIRGKGDVIPLVSASRAAPTIRAINTWMDDDPSRDVTYIVNDSRSKLVCRDLKWPPRLPILAQYNLTRWQQHYRFRDKRHPSEFDYDLNEVSVNKQHWTALQRYISTDFTHISL